jgi:hypothetical protein
VKPTWRPRRARVPRLASSGDLDLHLAIVADRDDRTSLSPSATSRPPVAAVLTPALAATGEVAAITGKARAGVRRIAAAVVAEAETTAMKWSKDQEPWVFPPI